MLPRFEDAAAFAGVLFDPGQWTAAIATIQQRHNLSGPFEQSTTGSTVVFLSRTLCIKLHPPFPGFVASQAREVAALKSIAGSLPIATPELVAQGELEGWTYFISTRLPGRPIDAVWATLNTPDRTRLAAQLGEAIAVLHQVDPTPVGTLTEPWKTFRPAQRARCVSLERSKGMDATTCADLELWLQRADAIEEPPVPPSLLHTEIGPSHVLVDQGHVSGLIDFGDCMAGDPEYDLAPVGMFVTCGDATAFRAFCGAYGCPPDELADPRRTTRLLRHALLHRYGTLTWYRDVLSPPSETLDELAQHWFGVD